MALDTSEYRQNTYGVPDRYCDPTRSLSDNSGDGLSESTPWNLTQAAENCTPGMVIGVMPVGASLPIQMPSSGSIRIPAWDIRESGTDNDNRITFVTKYAAVALADIETNPLRTELRHTGTPCPTYGSYFRSYVTFDGFYVDMAHSMIGEDTGLIRVEEGTDVWFKNFVIKGTHTTISTNCVMWRPQNAQRTILSNFKAYNFSNTGLQGALFSDQYGDQDFIIEHFEISNIEECAIYLKGTAGGNFNYGTIRYGIVHDCGIAFQFNDLHPTELTELHHCLAYNIGGGDRGALSISSETSAGRNLLVHHNTFAKVQGISGNACWFSRALGYGSGSNGVTVRDNIFDMDVPSTGGHMIDHGEIDTFPEAANYNAYYRQGSAFTMSWNDDEYDLPGWRSVSGLEVNSAVLSTSPFIDRDALNFGLMPEHPALTMSSTGGEVGYHDTEEVVGVDVDELIGGGGTPVEDRICGSPFLL